MNRPCFSLGVLLSSLAVCLFAVGSANSQTSVDVHAPPCLMCPYSAYVPSVPSNAYDVSDLCDIDDAYLAAQRSDAEAETATHDSYNYDDYFAEVFGGADESNEVPTPSVAASVVCHEDVDAFDYFDVDAYAPEATEPEDSFVGSDDSDAEIYDLRTSYDATYDEVMAPTVESPAPTTPDFAGTDHCFGGYADAFPADYRCDLADEYLEDAYRSFYHAGPDPSASVLPAEVLPAETAEEMTPESLVSDVDAS